MTSAEEEAAAWEALPQEEHKSVWDETEKRFWSDFRRSQEGEHTSAEQEYQRAVTDIKIELGTLTGRQSQLSATRTRLAKELAAVEEEFAHVSEECDDKSNTLQRIEHDYREKLQARLETRETVYKTMKNFFREKRGRSPEGESHEDFDINTLAGARGFSTEGLSTNGTVRDVDVEGATPDGTAMEGVEYRNGEEDADAGDVVVNVVDADGGYIGPVQRIEPWNQWVEAILELPIQRPVKIRRGRRFNDTHLSTIYERSEAKGVKWLSCLIQATGEVQTKRCQSCEKNQGAFDDCIIVGGDLFQKCGNCEWNRQGCHGASGPATDLSRRRPRKTRDSFQEIEEVQDESPVEIQSNAEKESRREPEIETTPIVEQPTAPPPPPPPAPTPAAVLPRPELPPPYQSVQPTTEADAVMKDAPAVENRAPQEPEQMPTPREYRVTPGFTPANTRSRPPSADRPTPTSLPVEPSPQPTDSNPEESPEEITRENLILQQNGTFYTYPDCVAGVPLVKIDENHPYWDPSWQNVRALIEPQLARWREKHQAAIDAGPKLEKGGSSKYQIGRQVNRGIKILEFLDEGEISPYQLLGKAYIQSGKGGICSYDTLFRLSESLSELAKFKLDIQPVEWMRHRLWELMQSEGSSFNLPRTIHDFYHDEKLTALRYKHGFKNIGRPSGIKTSRQSGGSPSATPKAIKKRKSMHSMASTPRADPNAVDQSPLATQMSLPPPESPFSTHLQKKPKYLSPANGPIHDEFQTADYSDADSWSGAPLSKVDFRLYQVKTRLYTSSTQVTQYWSYLKDDQAFEHQVLKSLNPVGWGLHKDPIDFHLYLDEIAEIAWNVQALRVHVVVRKEAGIRSKKDGEPRGDVMAAFKRERTMRRFLNLCRDLNVHMIKEST